MTARSAETDSARLEAFLHYQETMRAFLRTQQAVIGAYLTDALVPGAHQRLGAASPAAGPLCGPRRAQRADYNGGPPNRGHAPVRAPRCVLTVEPAPLAADKPHPWPAGVLLATDDGRGTAQRLQAALNSTPTRVVVCDPAAMNSRAAMRAAMDAARAGQPLVGVLHLAPMSDAPTFPHLTADEWTERLDREIRAALFLLQAAAPELAASRDGAFLFAAFSRGADAFEPGPVKAGPHPWRGGLAGLLRSAAKEWPGARIRAIDVDDATAELLAEVVPREWGETAPVEIGLRGGARLTIEPSRAEWTDDAPSPEPCPSPSGVPSHADSARSETVGTDRRGKPRRDGKDDPLPLDATSTVVVTGGARGITAECVHELARCTHARFILLGRTTAPDAEEPAATRDIADIAELRRAVVALKQAAGEKKPAPKAVESEVTRLLREREIRATLSRLRTTGATAEYVPCDVRDGAAFEAVLRDIRARHGRIDGVIHGAGVIEDKLIVDKTPESYARVIGTKLDPLLTLTHSLDWGEARFCLLFASIAGSFGNPGQADYGAANEIMNRLASSLRTLCPGHVVAVNWGPWGGGGMVTEEVARQFAERGVGLVPPEGGRRIVREELLFGRRDARLVVGDGLWIADANRRAVRDGLAASLLLRGARIEAYDEARLHATVSIGLDSHPMLVDHSMDAKPVLPLMFALELMAEAVARVSFGRRVVAVRDVRLFQGVVVEGAARDVAVVAERQPSGGEACRVSPAPEGRGLAPKGGGGVEGSEETWAVRLLDASRQERPFYSATVVTAGGYLGAAPLPELPALEGAFPKRVADAYGDWLFHGPAFQRITAIPHFEKSGADATVEPAYSGTGEAGPQFCFDPMLLDTIPQLATLWSRACFDTFPLPNRIASFQALAPVGAAPVSLRLRFDPASDGTNYKADAWIERDGRVLWEIRGLEGTGSRDLNRLSRR